DNMSLYVASQVSRLLNKRRILPMGARVLILGLTFKENCPDIRNTQVVAMVKELRRLGCEVDVHDPWVDPEVARTTYDLELCLAPEAGTYDGIIVAVSHHQFRDMGVDAIRALGKDPHVLYDVKHLFAPDQVDGRL
ncbi:MAG: Vi polysaccharide biosynthesis UDP-N-acetylglucosamine C-6 dehydrogenase TviB, partial [Halioglobus sp.]|nr:Vi polysaccharide biosynthesis UDP-N-acetylglucosamine C-6 dehydrogenase TviB [Halioglobus sp.]